MVDYLSLTISIGAVAVSVGSFVFNYRRTRKTEQLKQCIEISSALNDAKSKISELIDKLNSNTTDQQLIQGWRINLGSAYLSYLNHWEFFSLLVNTKEIHEEKILDFYKDHFKKEVERCLDEYPDVRDDKERYKEIKKLLKKWDPNYYSLHFEK